MAITLIKDGENDSLKSTYENLTKIDITRIEYITCSILFSFYTLGWSWIKNVFLWIITDKYSLSCLFCILVNSKSHLLVKRFRMHDFMSFHVFNKFIKLDLIEILVKSTILCKSSSTMYGWKWVVFFVGYSYFRTGCIWKELNKLYFAWKKYGEIEP